MAAAARTRVPTGELNRFFENLTTASPPVTAGKRNVRVMYASQASVAPPTFVLFTNARDETAFFVRAVSRKPAPRDIRVFRQADPHSGSGPQRPRKERKTAAERAPDGGSR